MRSREPRVPLVAPGEIDHHVGDLTATLSADVTLAAVQAKLRESNQWLPIDGDPEAPVGQLVQRNSTGPLRLGYGAWRDLLLGAQFTNGPGELITAGGRTMKNVAGYDLTKFMVGQYGLVGQIVTITVRTYRRPQGAVLAEFPFSELAVSKLLPTPARPQWAMMHAGRLFCGCVGNDRALDFYQQILPAHGATHVERQSIEQDIAFRAERWLAGRSATVFRASVPPARVREMLRSVPDPRASADAAFGVVVGSCSSESEITQVERAAKALGGSAIVEEPQRLSAILNGPGATAALLQRLRLAFDTDGRLAPLSLAPVTNTK
jgi:hypothetical protein